jgi:chromosome segregation ATPase
MTIDEQIKRLSEDNSELKVLLHNCREEKKKTNQQLLQQELDNKELRKELEAMRNEPPVRITLVSISKKKQEITEHYISRKKYEESNRGRGLLEHRIKELQKEIAGLKGQIKILSV